MTFQIKTAAICAALTLSTTSLLADAHSGGGLILEVPKNICAKTKHLLEHWAKDETQYTAYVTRISSEQAAATCFDIDRSSKLYAASHAKVKVMATTRALVNCARENGGLAWCVVIGTVSKK